MNAIGELDLMPSRSVAELNRVRNKMEHEYAIPQINDLTLYFDLVAGFVAAVEGAIFMLASNAEMHYFAQLSESEAIHLRVGFDTQTAEFVCSMSDASGDSEFKASADDWGILMESLRILFLLVRFGYIVSHEYVLKH